MPQPKRILIYRFGNLGDIVCAMPAMVAVRQFFPKAWIGFLTNKEMSGSPDPESILSGNNFLNEIITYNTTKLREPGYLLAFFKKMYSLKIDLMIYLARPKTSNMRLCRDYVFFRLTVCRRLVGFKRRKPSGSYVKDGVILPVFTQEVDRLVALLTPLGINQTEIKFCLPIKEKDIQAIDSLWLKHDLANANPIVAVCPGGKWPVKLWNVANFAKVVSILQKTFGATILLVGGQSEKAAGEEIVKGAGDSVINLIGKMSYMESAEVISRCKLLISNDCGPVHLAAAVKTPVVGIYASRDFPGSWHPWGDIHTVLRNDTVDCRFCFKTTCETLKCINSITVEQVIDACSQYLNNGQSCKL